jgi:hypothetical protein
MNDGAPGGLAIDCGDLFPGALQKIRGWLHR